MYTIDSGLAAAVILDFGFEDLSLRIGLTGSTPHLPDANPNKLRTLYAHLRFRWVALIVFPRLLARLLRQRTEVGRSAR